ALLGGSQGAAGTLILRDPSGAEKGRTGFSILQSQWTQKSIAQWFSGMTIPSGARVEIVPSSGSLDAYAPRVDNGTGHGVVFAAAFVPGPSSCTPPFIYGLTPDPPSATAGSAVTLTLVSENATAAVVYPGGIPIPPNGSITVHPTASTTY